MMMRYKLAHKRNTRVSPSPTVDVDSMTTATKLSLSSFRTETVQPKRVSLGSISSCSTQFPVHSVNESPMPQAQGLPDKPSKTAAPSEVCFSPIDACRRLDFETPARPTVNSIDWSRTLLFPPKPKKATLVSPRLTPDSTSGPSFEELLSPTNKGTSFPSGLYIPTGDETMAAGWLLALKKKEGIEVNNEKEVEAPLIFTPPKRRRATLSRAAKDMCHDLRPDLLLSDEEEDEYELEPPPKKKRAISCTASKRSTPSLCTEVPSAVVTVNGNKKERTVSLAMPDDSNELNSLHCFVRADLLEVFSIDDDNHKRGTRSVPRVGLRCVHCGHLPRKEKEGASMSIFYPKSLQDIYRSVCTWQRIHFKACKHVPQELVEQYDYFKDMDRTRGKKQHWVESARRLGLRNIDDNRGGIVWKTDKGN